MKRKNRVLKALLITALCVCFCLPVLAEETTEVVTPQVVQQNPNGSITVQSTYDVPYTPEGGMVVQSGQIQVEVPMESEQERGPLTQEEWQQRLDRAASINGAETPTIWRDPATGEIYDVEVRYVGIGRSMIVLNGSEMLVNTVDLSWVNEAPEGMVLAVVTTPKNGYAAMYAGKSKKTTLLKQCRTDSVVRVISSGDRWTLVDHEGLRGYVQTSSLEFFLNDHTDFQSAVISVNGKTKGKDSVNVRSRDEKCRVLQDYALGTPLTVFDIVDEWAEVDVCGWHCRINTKFLTLEKETASAE